LAFLSLLGVVAIAVQLRTKSSPVATSQNQTTWGCKTLSSRAITAWGASVTRTVLADGLNNLSSSRSSSYLSDNPGSMLAELIPRSNGTLRDIFGLE
jgi:hypothetical protein